MTTYLYHKDLNNYWITDIEGTLIPSTVVHCIVTKNAATKQVYRFYDGEEVPGFSRTGGVSDFRSWSQSNLDRYWVGHNFLSYDGPTLNRLLGTSLSLDKIVDTLVLSFLYDPRLLGGHSIEAWGERVGLPKIGLDVSFDKFSPELLARCERDVNVNEHIFFKLTRAMQTIGFSERSCRLEHEIRYVVNKQQQNGFFFDIPRAEGLLTELRELSASLAAPVQRLFPPALVPAKTFKYKTKQDGTPFASYNRHILEYPKVELRDGSYTCFDWKEFNLGSPLQRYEKLLELGWKPEEMGAKRTKTGKSWQIDEDALNAFMRLCNPAYKDTVHALANWIVINGRGNMVSTWLDCVNYVDSCIHGTVWTCGARTRRMTHTNPNTANIPKAKEKVQYGRECRELWRARPGRVLVGYDAISLEMLMFCHYVNNPEVTKIFLDKPHDRNAAAWSDNPWGMPVDRDGPPGAKTGFYAGLYGARDPKLGQSIWIGGTEKMGAWARKRLYETTPGLERVIQETTDEYKQTKGLIKTIDGGFIRCKSLSAAFNGKCQSAGGLVMKQAAIFVDQRTRHLDQLLVGSIHDEAQHDTLPKDAEELGNISVQCIRDAGEELNFNVQLDGNFKIGSTWADTH